MKIDLHKTLCKAMRLEYFPTGKVIFYFGDFPDKFFILLHGKVVILLKKK